METQKIINFLNDLTNEEPEFAKKKTVYYRYSNSKR